ncbi:MAG: hypothetical protein WCW36_00015 [Candidatus Paceibacterota bacterium]
MSTECRQWAIQNTEDAIRLFAEAVKNRASSVHAMAFPEGTIKRHVRVDRTRTPQKVIDATGRKQYVDKDVLATMPIGEGEEVDVHFVPTKRFVPAKDVPAFLAQYGLVPDPRATAAVNEADSAFADAYPNCTQWGDNCYLTFDRWDDERRVCCDRSGHDWDDYWFLAGVPASRK